MKKEYFFDITDLKFLIKTERNKRKVKDKWSSNDTIILETIYRLMNEERSLINEVNGNNFCEIVNKIIEIDSQISEYIFFLIHSDLINEDNIDKIVEKDSLNDYYTGLLYSDELNKYKFIVHPDYF